MKSQFSKSWKGSSQVRKQRKYEYNAPLHIKRKFLSTTLDKELRKKYSIRNIEIRKGDEIIIMKGKFKGKKGKVLSTDVDSSKVNIEGIQATKRDGAKVNFPIHASNLKIVSLNMDDKKRMKRLRGGQDKKSQGNEKIEKEEKTKMGNKKETKINKGNKDA